MAQQQVQQGKPKVTRLPLLGAYSNRDATTSKDQRYVNIFPETRKVEQLENTKIAMLKRPGLSLYKNFGSGVGRGISYFKGKFYVAIGNTVYEDGATPTSKITLTGSTGPLGMLLANSASLGDYLFICDGTSAWFIKSDGSVTQVVDADFPSPHIPTPVFIDGYIALPRANSVDVFTCDLDQPGSWTASNFLSAEMFPDYVVALSRQNNQVCVLGTSSIEFFYDAANASGSPLSRNDSTTIQMGTCSPYAVIGNEKYIFYLSQSDSGGRSAWLIDGFQPKKVSDEFIERILDSETNITAAHGFGVRTKGHLFYVINLVGIGRTLVYDSDEKLWHEWSSNSSGSHAIFRCSHIADNGSGVAYLLDNSNGNVYTLNPSAYDDNGTSILVEIVTNKYDMDTYHRKFMWSLRLVADRYNVASANSVTLNWTDDDYQNWSNDKTISLTDDWPAFQRLGSFRRRAFRVRHSSNNPLRLESLEVEYTEGTN